jgi:hypothetical protein
MKKPAAIVRDLPTLRAASAFFILSLAGILLFASAHNSRAQSIQIFYDDFGCWDNLDIPGWDEVEAAGYVNKCRVQSYHARIVGEDVGGVNHYFYRHWDMRGYVSGSAKFQCRRSAGWEVDDELYFEVYYGGAWHGHTVFNAVNMSDTAFVEVELPFTFEMMTYDFGVRYRNGMDAVSEYVEIDDFYLYGNPSIPTLSVWGTIVLMGVLLFAGTLVAVHRKRPAGKSMR